jgi:hypothetical protein
MRRFALVIVVCWAGLGIAAAGFAQTDAPAALTVSPDVLNVGLFFSGGEVAITGEIPVSQDVVVEIIGPQVNSLFNVKGRIGPFWLTREKVDLENAPALYILLLPPGPDWENKAAALNLGIDNLKQQIGISRSETAPDDIFRMFLKLKRSEKLYSELPGAVSYSAGENGRRRFTAACRLPSSTAVGKYTVKATTIANGDRSAELSRDLTVQEVGFVEMVNRMASKRRLTYGVAAVLIALFSGALMGLLFKSSGRH